MGDNYMSKLKKFINGFLSMDHFIRYLVKSFITIFGLFATTQILSNSIAQAQQSQDESTLQSSLHKEMLPIIEAMENFRYEYVSLKQTLKFDIDKLNEDYDYSNIVSYFNKQSPPELTQIIIKLRKFDQSVSLILNRLSKIKGVLDKLPKLKFMISRGILEGFHGPIGNKVFEIKEKVKNTIDKIKAFRRIKMALELKSDEILNRDFLSGYSLDFHFTVLKSGASGEIENTLTQDDGSLKYLVKFKFKNRFENNFSDEKLWVTIDSADGSDQFYEIAGSNLRVKEGQTGIAYSHDPTDLNNSNLDLIIPESIYKDQKEKSEVSLNKLSISRKISSDADETTQRGERPEGSSIKIISGSVWSPLCKNFINENGEYGPWGKSIVNSLIDENGIINKNALWLIGSNSNSVFDTANGIKLNNKFRSYSVNQKLDFIVYYAASVAMLESSCNPKIKARGPNGTAGGLWQLHEGKTQNYAKGVCGKFDVYKPELNVVCGLKMLDYYTAIEKNINHEFFWKGNYWETMHIHRPGGKKTFKLIKKYESI